MRNVSYSDVIMAGLMGLATLQAQTSKLTAAQAKDHVGERATVCGTVASTRYAEKSKGQPTFLNLDEPYPKQIFTILIRAPTARNSGRPRTNTGTRDCVQPD